MSGNHFFYIRSWHFLLAIVIFCVLTGIIAGKDARDTPLMEKGNSFLTELQDIDPGSPGITCVFFYREDSELCRRMRYNIEQLDVETFHGIAFYAINVEEYPEYFYRYNVSGIPNLLIFNGDVEEKRVMGVIPTRNLEKIMNRVKAY